MKAIVLFSSGIDSPVAAFLSNEKGIELIGLNFYNGSLNDRYKSKLIELAKIVGIKKLYFADHSSSHKEYSFNSNTRFQCVFCKRTMLRIAEKIAEKENCDFIITGDNIGQVATQTIENLNVVSSVTKISILRPLLTFDKNDIVDIARKIGTFNINLNFKSGCPFLPKNPSTKAKLNVIEFEESKIDINEIISKIINESIIVNMIDN